MDQTPNPSLPPAPGELSPGQPSSPPDWQLQLRAVFFGRYGLRAGWRLVIFAALFFFFFFLVGGIASLLLGLGSRPRSAARLSPGLVILQETLLLSTLFLTLLIIARFERRPLDSYGLPARRAFGGTFWAGAVLGFVFLTALLLGIRGLNGFAFGSVALSGKALIYYATLWAVAFTMVGIFEEYFSRGYMQFVLTRGMGFWPAAILTSLLFAALHRSNQNESAVGLAAVFAVGLFFCLTLRRTGDLWFAVGFHASWDYAQSFLYGVPDSGEPAIGHLFNSHFHGPAWLTGGAVGPEGSVLVFADLAIAALVVARLYPEVKYPEAAAPNPVAIESCS